MSTAIFTDFGKLNFSKLMKQRKYMERDLVLKLMKEAGKPVAAGEVATLSGLDRKVVDRCLLSLRRIAPLSLQ